MTQPDRKAILAGTKQSWKRAHKLAELADGTIINLGAEKPGRARAFLAAHKDSGYTELLAKKTDKRNPAIREMLSTYESWLTTGKTTTRRPSKGDPEKPVRGGAPTPRKRGGRPRSIKEEIPYQVLAELRAIQKKHGVPTADLLYYTDLLGRLCDDPADIDAFVRRAKETRKAMA